ncbi:MAG: protein-L-isoaspartate(D-aspartate) O-methyltransferase [Anaerolineales bacterium]
MDYDKLRTEMVEEQLRKRDISDFRVLQAMERVPRHEFVPRDVRHLAYKDRALAIGHEQTISQPYIVALMLQALQMSGHEMILEIGTGSGYQTALLCELGAYVYTLERKHALAEDAASNLARLGYKNLDIHVGDGSQGLADMGPFDTIIVSACVPSIPGPLKAQLRPQNGRLILPVGSHKQQYLQLVKRDYDQWHVDNLLPVRFVPLIGRYGFSSV